MGNRLSLGGLRVPPQCPADRPDSERIDALIEDDLIPQTGNDVESAGADVVDLHGRIVIPGLINAHLHTWQTALRLIGADWTLPQYFTNARDRIAPHYRPDDVHIGNLVGALNQINCGTTSLGDWCHNNPTPEHSDAAVAALQQRASAPSSCTADRIAPRRRPPTPRSRPAHRLRRREGLFGPTTNVVHGEGLTEDWFKILADAGVSFTITPENELGNGHGQPVTAPLLRYRTAPSLGIDTETAIGGELLTAARVALAHHHTPSTFNI